MNKRWATYERRVARYLQNLATELGWAFEQHPKLPYKDTWCEPDFVLTAPSGHSIIVETKMTECDCWGQIAKYKSVIPNSIGVQVCRRVLNKPTMAEFEDAFDGGVFLLWV